MGLVNDVLEEFEGQLSIDQIGLLTYKELGYLRKHRQESIKKKQPTMKDLPLT